ncbi:MAG: hypothetical protein ACP5NV_03945 [Candidatus Woesearchaeota archaeon]
MEKKNFNLSIATATFVLGAFFVLANTKDITANVIGASGPGATITAVTGIILIIASAGFFVFAINHGDTHLERLVRETKDTEEIKTQVEEQKAKEKYDKR